MSWLETYAKLKVWEFWIVTTLVALSMLLFGVVKFLDWWDRRAKRRNDRAR